jgi:hypothetical protein
MNNTMSTILKIIASIIIIVGLYMGIRYVGAVVHYACAVPEEDCPPPFKGLGDLAFIMTGGNLVPWWTKN